MKNYVSVDAFSKNVDPGMYGIGRYVAAGSVLDKIVKVVLPGVLISVNVYARKKPVKVDMYGIRKNVDVYAKENYARKMKDGIEINVII